MNNENKELLKNDIRRILNHIPLTLRIELMESLSKEFRRLNSLKITSDVYKKKY
jgi:hypothetical protein